MLEMIGEFPALHQTIVAERDIYLTHTLRQATRCVESPFNGQSEYCITQQALVYSKNKHLRSTFLVLNVHCSLEFVKNNL